MLSVLAAANVKHTRHGGSEQKVCVCECVCLCVGSEGAVVSIVRWSVLWIMHGMALSCMAG